MYNSCTGVEGGIEVCPTIKLNIYGPGGRGGTALSHNESFRISLPPCHVSGRRDSLLLYCIITIHVCTGIGCPLTRTDICILLVTDQACAWG